MTICEGLWRALEEGKLRSFAVTHDTPGGLPSPFSPRLLIRLVMMADGLILDMPVTRAFAEDDTWDAFWAMAQEDADKFRAREAKAP